MADTAPFTEPPIVVFDVGNVLIHWDPRHLYSKIFAGDPARMDWFLANVATPQWNVEQDRGRSWSEGVALLIREHPDWAAEIRAFDERWHEMVPGAIDANVAVLRTLAAAGAPVYAITNFSLEKWRETRRRFAFLDAFTGVVVSAEEGLIKPDPAIYRLLESRYGLTLKGCVFIDDSAANIAGAAALGMRTIHYTGPEVDVAAELRALGVTAL